MTNADPGSIHLTGHAFACLRHGRTARVYRLKYPQPESTPLAMRWVAPGPRLFMCDYCASEAKEWAEEGEP